MAPRRKSASLSHAKSSAFMETPTAADDEVTIQNFDPLDDPMFIPALRKSISDS